jgi:Xaa-Pro aminopeptidase
MDIHKIDVYLVPTDDYHLSEYVGDYFKTREYLSGFTGSAGTLIVTKDEAGLWTDGRYYIQAEEELQDSGILLYKDGTEGVPSVKTYLEKTIHQSQTLGFDGRCMTAEQGLRYETITKNLQYELDLTEGFWEDRPQISKEAAYALPIEYSGESYQDKLQKVRDAMKLAQTECFLLTALDEIAWLLNIRGNDVAYNPVVLSYLMITSEQVTLYCFSESVSGILDYLQENQINIRDYYSIYEDVKQLKSDSKVLLDKNRVNYWFYKTLTDNGCTIVHQNNPTYLQKAVKNVVESENIKLAHLKDGIAYVRFLYWFKNNVGKIPMDELTVAEHLRVERSGMEHFVEESFESIAAYGAHGAIVHYAANIESKAEILPEGFLLLDTGGHYLEGTTDITRTLVCGPLTQEQKQLYTAVLRGNLNLAAAKFPKGVTGCNLDILARQPLWELGLDYKHGTGHGVGYLLNVHEGPQAIRWRTNIWNPPLEAGMLVSNEPGIYLEGAFGIRLENLLLCKKSETSKQEEFLEWETMTLVPFEREAILPEQITMKERKWLNDYHERVYQEISPHLTKEEAEFLREYTREI